MNALNKFDKIDREIENELEFNWIKIVPDQLPERLRPVFAPGDVLYISKDEKYIAIPGLYRNLFETWYLNINPDDLDNTRDYNLWTIYNEFSAEDNQVRDLIVDIIDGLFEEL